MEEEEEEISFLFVCLFGCWVNAWRSDDWWRKLKMCWLHLLFLGLQQSHYSTLSLDLYSWKHEPVKGSEHVMMSRREVQYLYLGESCQSIIPHPCPSTWNQHPRQHTSKHTRKFVLPLRRKQTKSEVRRQKRFWGDIIYHIWRNRSTTHLMVDANLWKLSI